VSAPPSVPCGSGTGAKLFSLGYNYPLSKRTSLGVVYSKLNNDAGGAYQFYTNSALGNSGAAAVGAGVDQSLVYLGLRHVF
jgi:predicted porin